MSKMTTFEVNEDDSGDAWLCVVADGQSLRVAKFTDNLGSPVLFNMALADAKKTWMAIGQFGP